MTEPFGLSEKEAAGALDVHPDTLRRWRKRGAVGFAITPGGRIRYSREDIRRLLLSMKVDPQLGPVLHA